MGLFDRIKARAADSKKTEADSKAAAATGAPDAEQLIEEGNALEDSGLLDQALQRYDAAIRHSPRLARAHLNRGNVLLAQGDTERALSTYATALAYNPVYAPAHFNSGNAHLAAHQSEAALAAYDRALDIKPDFVDAEVARSGVLSDLGRLDDAAASYRRVLASKPDFAEIHFCLGNALASLGRPDESVESYRRALQLKPEFVEVHSSLGSVLEDLGRFAEAAVSYQLALAARPDFFEVHGNLGNVLKNLGQLDAAVASYRRVLALQPNSAEAHGNLGAALKELGRVDEAMASYRRALKINPAFAGAHKSMGLAYKDLGQLYDAEASLRKALQFDPEYVEAYSNLMFLHNYRADQPAALAEAQRFGDMVVRCARPFTAWRNSPDPDRCLRVGFVSGDLRAHPVGYFIDGVMTALAKEVASRLELYAYLSKDCSDELAQRIKAHCAGWRPVVGLSDEVVAHRIREDSIDVLIDLAGHTGFNRLAAFAWKPAPVQLSWLGYFATTGVAAIDYLIADPWTLPESEEAYFTEEIWRLPETRLCFSAPNVNLPVSPLPALGNGNLTFGCFNNLTKMNEAVVAVWSRLLAAVPGSQLFLMDIQFANTSVRKAVADRFALHGIHPKRLILGPRVPRAEYLASYQRVDIALDPFPYTGGATTVEALWMGVPVLTLAGKSFVSRQGVGLLMNAGLPDWIASDEDDYVNRAVAFGADLARLAELRQRLRQQVLASPVFDAPRFARNFEAALRGMWRRWCDLQLS